MTSVSDLGHLLGKRLECMSWREEGCFDLIFRKELKKTIYANSGSIDATRDIRGILRTAVGCIDPDVWYEII